jgi:hypothetical protein
MGPSSAMTTTTTPSALTIGDRSTSPPAPTSPPPTPPPHRPLSPRAASLTNQPPSIHPHAASRSGFQIFQTRPPAAPPPNRRRPPPAAPPTARQPKFNHHHAAHRTNRRSVAWPWPPCSSPRPSHGSISTPHGHPPHRGGQPASQLVSSIRLIIFTFTKSENGSFIDPIHPNKNDLTLISVDMLPRSVDQGKYSGCGCGCGWVAAS